MSGLHARIRAGSGTPLVLLHGFGGHCDSWQPVIDRLPAETQVICYDLPGHAGSLSYPNAGPPKIAVKAILEDLSQRGVELFHLAGHSMGGAISTLIALAAPDRVASLTLLAPGGYGPEINGPLLRRFAAATDADELTACLHAMSGPNARLDPGLVDTIQRLRAAEGQRTMLETIGAAITRDDRQGVIPAEAVSTIRAPTILVWGEDDPVLPYAQSANAPRRFQLISLPATGHMLVEEAPQIVAEMIASQMTR